MTRYYIKLRNGKESSGIRHPYMTLAMIEAIDDRLEKGEYTIEMEADDGSGAGGSGGGAGAVRGGGAGGGMGKVSE